MHLHKIFYALAFGCVVAIILLVNTNSNGSHEVESEEDANEF